MTNQGHRDTISKWPSFVVAGLLSLPAAIRHGDALFTQKLPLCSFPSPSPLSAPPEQSSHPEQSIFLCAQSWTFFFSIKRISFIPMTFNIMCWLLNLHIHTWLLKSRLLNVRVLDYGTGRLGAFPWRFSSLRLPPASLKIRVDPSLLSSNLYVLWLVQCWWVI